MNKGKDEWMKTRMNKLGMYESWILINEWMKARMNKLGMYESWILMN